MLNEGPDRALVMVGFFITDGVRLLGVLALDGALFLLGVLALDGARFLLGALGFDGARFLLGILA
jgi:hypothetical protein